LPLAGFYVGTGQFSFLLAVVAATIGSLLGALVIYEFARRGGRPLLLRYGTILRVRESDLDRADIWFGRYGGWLVFGGRMIPGIRSLVSIPAGLTSMQVGRFAMLTIVGSAIWNAALIGAGWGLGSNYEKVGAIIGPTSTAIIAVVVLAAIVISIWWLRRRPSPSRRTG